jgi:hypothetical protein
MKPSILVQLHVSVANFTRMLVISAIRVSSSRCDVGLSEYITKLPRISYNYFLGRGKLFKTPRGVNHPQMPRS